MDNKTDEQLLLQQHLVTLRARVDAFFAVAMASQPKQFACKAGCSRCCQQQLSVFEVEAVPIRDALSQLQITSPQLRAIVREQAADSNREACPLLVDDRCTVYESRPLICRSHGLAVVSAFTDTNASTPSHCSLNYTSEPPMGRYVLQLDAVNQPLSVLASLSRPDEPERRIQLAQLAGEA